MGDGQKKLHFLHQMVKKMNMKKYFKQDAVSSDLTLWNCRKNNSKYGKQCKRFVKRIRNEQCKNMANFRTLRNDVSVTAVSYTHLDVYKRQVLWICCSFRNVFLFQVCGKQYPAKHTVCWRNTKWRSEQRIFLLPIKYFLCGQWNGDTSFYVNFVVPYADEK